MSEPEGDGGDDDFGSVVGGSFGVAGGEASELFEPVEAAFDDVALLVGVFVEGGWAAAGGASGSSAGDLVGAFRAREADPAVPERSSGGGMGVGLVRDHSPGPFPWPATPRRTDADLVQQRQEFGVVAGLAWGDEDRHRQAAAVDREVDLAGQPAPGPAQRLALDREGLDPSGRTSPFFRAPAAC